MASWKLAVVALLVAPLVLTCNDEDDEMTILPIRAIATVDPVTDDPALFFAPSSLDTTTDDSIVSIDVMVRMTSAQEFDDVSLHVTFDPGVVQFAGFVQSPDTDGITYDPFGLCNSGATYCGKYHPDPTMPPPPPPTAGPLCESDATSQPGNLFLGMAAQPSPSSLCDSHTQGGTFKLVTLNFIAATVGTSRIGLVATNQTGDCEILNDLMDLAVPVPCIDGNATITASR